VFIWREAGEASEADVSPDDSRECTGTFFWAESSGMWMGSEMWMASSAMWRLARSRSLGSTVRQVKRAGAAGGGGRRERGEGGSVEVESVAGDVSGEAAGAAWAGTGWASSLSSFAAWGVWHSVAQSRAGRRNWGGGAAWIIC
jgi:hypothetical protein